MIYIQEEHRVDWPLGAVGFVRLPSEESQFRCTIYDYDNRLRWDEGQKEWVKGDCYHSLYYPLEQCVQICHREGLVFRFWGQENEIRLWLDEIKTQENRLTSQRERLEKLLELIHANKPATA